MFAGLKTSLRYLMFLLGAAIPATAMASSAYDFSFQALMKPEDVHLSSFKGKVVLVVNTASKCGFTPQYAGLETLHKTYASKGLVVIGVPSNDFASQEPGSSEEIAKFCTYNYGVSFQMTEKEVVTGSQAHPFYVWARTRLGFGSGPKWNFHKYLINRQGDVVDYFNSTTDPLAPRVIERIEQLLATRS